MPDLSLFDRLLKWRDERGQRVSPVPSPATVPSRPVSKGLHLRLEQQHDPNIPIVKQLLPSPGNLTVMPMSQRLNLVKQTEKEYKIPPGLLYKLIKTESTFDPTKVSSKGALGIAQFMPETAKEMGINPLKIEEAVPGAAKYLLQNKKRFGSWPHAFAAYNWGPTNLARHGLYKAPPETRDFLEKIYDLPYHQILRKSNARISSRIR